eukprot:887471_1
MPHLEGEFSCRSCHQSFRLKIDLIRHVTSTHSGQESELLGSGDTVKPEASTDLTVKQEPSISPGGQFPEFPDSSNTVKRDHSNTQNVELYHIESRNSVKQELANCFSNLQPDFPDPGNLMNLTQASVQPRSNKAQLASGNDMSILGCEIKFSCTECPKVFFSGRNLALHFASIHPDKPKLCRTLCNECGTVCNTVSDLRVHLKSHFVCKSCGNSFGNLSNLNQHTSHFHGASKLHACILCRKHFEDASVLKKHTI